MNPQPRRVRLRKVFRIAAFVLLGVIAVSVLWWKALERRAWGRLERRVPELDLEIRRLSADRKVLRGAVLPGQAWDDYLEAGALAVPSSGGPSLWEFLGRKEGVAEAPIRQEIAKNAEALDRLCRGTHREQAGRALFPVGKAYELGEFPPFARLVGLGGCHARFLGKEGRARESAELILDLLQFTGDLQRQGSLYGAGMGWHHSLLEELSRLVQDAAPGDGMLAQIERELEILETTYPRDLISHLGGLEDLGRVLLEDKVFDYFSGSSKQLRPSTGYGLFYLLTFRLVQASGFEQLDRGLSRLKDADLESYSQESARWKALNATYKSSWNLLVLLHYPSGYGDGRVRRQAIAPLRLVRIAAHYRRTGEVLDLADPFGDRIQAREEAGELVVWTLGFDGVDRGGVGDFRSAPYLGCVLRVRR